LQNYLFEGSRLIDLQPKILFGPCLRTISYEISCTSLAHDGTGSIHVGYQEALQHVEFTSRTSVLFITFYLGGLANAITRPWKYGSLIALFFAINAASNCTLLYCQGKVKFLKLVYLILAVSKLL
jgi:hypothetical protein